MYCYLEVWFDSFQRVDHVAVHFGRHLNLALLQKKLPTPIIDGKNICVRRVDKHTSGRWRNGHAICKDLGSSPTYDQWSFSLVTRFLHSRIEFQR